jgi:D-alanyl-D-alanine carboxypeptidase
MTEAALRTTRTIAGVGVALIALTAGNSAFASERYAAYVIDAQTKEVLFSDMADEARFPASLTKMMTLYMLFEALDRHDLTLNTRMVTSRHAARMAPTKLGLRVGETIRVEDAIKAVVTKSANDAAVVIAEHLGGSESRFCALMTARARDLGMSSTQFVNASGLPNPRQRTTARDMAVLSRALVTDYPQYYAYFKTPGFSWRTRYARNHNHLLGEVAGVDGIKTGYTGASGFNLASSVQRNGRRIIAVVMGGRTAAARDAQMVSLIDDAFARLNGQAQPPTATFASLPVSRVTIDIHNPAPERASGVIATPVSVRTTQVPADRPTYTVAAAPMNMAGAMGAAAAGAAKAAAALVAPPAAAATLASNTAPAPAYAGVPLLPHAPGGEKPTDTMSPLEEMIGPAGLF